MNRRKKKYSFVMRFLLLLLLGFLTFAGTTYAWNSISQTARNECYEERDKGVVELLKFEKLADGTLTENPLSQVRFYLYAEDGTRIGGIYTTDELGKITLGLPEGTYYFEEIAPKEGYDYDQTVDGAKITRYWFTLSKDKEEAQVRVYNVRKTGSLTIEKWVENADGLELTEEQLNQEFAFKVTFSDGGTYSYRIDGGELQSVTSGGYIYLKHGQKAVLEGIPTGVIYTVIEEPPVLEDTSITETGQYLISSEHHRGTITEEGSTARFTNTYREEELEPLPVKLKVTKEVVGTVPTEDKDKAFDMTIDINGTQTDFSLKDGESKEFDVTVGDRYEVSEKDYTSEGYTQEILSGMGTVVGDTEVLVRNKYVREIRTDIYVEKRWNLNGVSENVLPKSITVQLKQGDVVVDEKEVTPNAEGVWSVTFDAPKYDADGNEIIYTVVELPVEGFQTSYDTSRAEEGILFIINTLADPTRITLPKVEKQVLGEDAPLTEFEFWLRGEEDAPMPEGTIGETKIVTIQQSGFVELGTITFTKAGEYRYTLAEVNGGKEHWTYDQSIYTLIVKVYETENGLASEQTLLKDGQPVEAIIFQNTYRTEEIVTPDPDPEDPTPDPENPTPDPEDPTSDPENPTPDPENPTPDIEVPDSSEQSPEDPVTQTGDPSYGLRYLFLWILSGSTIVGVLWYRKKQNIGRLF